MAAFAMLQYPSVDILGTAQASVKSEPEEEGSAGPSAQPRNEAFAIGAQEKVIAAAKQHQCSNGQDDRQSELCAQWKAVDAARESVHIAWWSLGSAVVLGIISTFFLIVTLGESRRTSQRQLRAYVSIGNGGMGNFVQPDGSRIIEYVFSIHNGGATPAYDCVHGGNVVIMDPDYAEEYFTTGWKKSPRIGRPLSYVVHGGGSADVSIQSHAPIAEEAIERLRSGEASLYAFGFVEYRDTFRKKRRTRFCRSVDGEEFARSDALARAQPGEANQMRWSVEPFHNDAN